MKRNGKDLPVLRDGHPRRMADGRNAWRKMNEEQRLAFLQFISSDVERMGFELNRPKLIAAQRELENK